MTDGKLMDEPRDPVREAAESLARAFGEVVGVAQRFGRALLEAVERDPAILDDCEEPLELTPEGGRWRNTVFSTTRISKRRAT